MWESALEDSGATHRQGVIIPQPIQKVSLWRLICKLNCWSPVALARWFYCTFLSMWRMRCCSSGGLGCRGSPGGHFNQKGAWPLGCSDHTRENGHITCVTYLLPPEQESKRQLGTCMDMSRASSTHLGATCREN